MPQKKYLKIEKRSDNQITIFVSGDWKLERNIMIFTKFEKEIAAYPNIKEIIINSDELLSWDSAILLFLQKLSAFCKNQNINLDSSGLPQGVKRLLELASPEHQRKDVSKQNREENFLIETGDYTIKTMKEINQIFEFIGGLADATVKFYLGKANFRFSDLFEVIIDSGAKSLPIVSLISVLVGLILAFVGAIQLRQFGAQIFVADIVGIGMVRVMAAIMTGVIMAGRTGAAFAARIGTMQVNEEIDALKTLGIPPMEFIVLPRMIGLTIMMPFLCVYADFMGIIGGFIVGIFMLDLTFMEFYLQTRQAITLTHFWIGLFHSFVFGILVSFAGCLRGMQCGRSASEVGNATTSAVVTAIVLIVIATAIITFSCEVLGI